ncbi:MAG: hypothetical protein GY768_16395 [Planctomycetaceae bacterium]|nr:hypothetical protein [Planctomycetaceae bacterium]
MKPLNPTVQGACQSHRVKSRSTSGDSLSLCETVDTCSKCCRPASRSQSGWSFCVYCAAVTLSLAPFQHCSAQNFGHTDVLFEYGSDKIEINARTFTSYFPTRGISKRFQTLPGFASESDVDQGIMPNDEIVYNVLSDLQFWVDGVLQPEQLDAIQIRVRNRPSSVADTILSAESGVQSGGLNPPSNRVGKASASGNFHSDLQWFLESTDDDAQPPLGTYAIQLGISTNRAAVADSDPFYFIWHYGADIDDYESAVAFFEESLSEPTLPGDFDGNGILDAIDIGLLSAEVRLGNDTPSFDLNADLKVNDADRGVWVDDLRQTYFGDANLDGEFNSSDFVFVFQAGGYEDAQVGNSAWATGDWNGDAEFNSGDFVIAFQAGGFEQGPRAAVAAVPEPVGSSGIVFGVIWLVASLRRRAGRSGGSFSLCA